MSDFLTLFYSGPVQFLGAGVVFALWLGLAGLGRYALPSGGLTELRPIYGWAVVASVYTILGTLTGLSFQLIGYGLFAVMALAVGLAFTQRQSILVSGSLKVLLLAAPLFLIATAMMASQWDEFSHWLPTTRFLLSHDGFPDAQTPITGATYPAYPYNWPLLMYLVSLPFGYLIEFSGGTLNLLLLFAYGLMALRMTRSVRGVDLEAPILWQSALFVVLAPTIFNPTFVQKVIFTGYADPGSAVMMACGAIIAWFMLEALADKDYGKARLMALQLGLLMLVLINIKQATMVLFVILICATGIAGVRDPQIRKVELFKLLPWVIIPAALIYGLWRHYVASEIPGQEFGILPFDQWNFHLIGTILTLMVKVALKKSFYFGIMIIAMILGLVSLLRWQGAKSRMAIIIGASFFAYNLFLFFTYVAVFRGYEAEHIASYWRYNQHLGLMASAFALYWLAHLWQAKIEGKSWQKYVSVLGFVLVIAAPVGFADKLRFDLEAPKPHMRPVAREVASLVGSSGRVQVLDPLGTGESNVITRFDGGRADFVTSNLSAYNPNDDLYMAKFIEQDKAKTHVLIFSMTPSIPKYFALDLDADTSYLLAPSDSGWTIVKSWLHPK